MEFSRAIGLGVALIAACSSYSNDDPAKAPPAATPAPDAGADAAAAPGVIYVSPIGDDNHAGTEEAAPLKTITFAISRAKAIGLHEIRVCSGLFDEPSLVLDAAISIRGGYDCNSWMRPSGFGYPDFAQGLAETRIIRSGTGTDSITFAIVGESVTRDAHVEGLTIDGPDTGVRGIALRVGGKAAPSIHDVIVRGGHTTASNNAIGSIGIGVFEAAAPEIMHARISGGFGTVDGDTNSAGAVGVRIENASPSLHDATINASDASATTNGVLVDGAVKLTGANALAHLQIATHAAAHAFGGITSSGTDAELEITGCTIDGSLVECDPVAGVCVSAAISAQNAANVVIAGNRLGGGNVSANRTAEASTFAIALTNVAAATVANNMLDSGNESLRPTVFATGIGIAGSPSVHFVHNTVAVAPSSRTGGVTLGEKATAVTVEGNLFVSPGPGSALVVDECNGSSLATLTANAFVGLDLLANVQYVGACGSYTGYAALKGLALRFPFQTKNVRIAPKAGCKEPNSACIEPTGCVASDLCAASVIDGWTNPSRDGMLNSATKLSVTAPCALVKGVDPLFANVTSDIFGAPRTAPASMGAVESDACAP